MPINKWDDSFYLKTYELIKSGLTEGQTAETLGVTITSFSLWKQKRPALIEAIEKGKIARKKQQEGDNNSNIASIIYHKLSPELQELWEKVLLCDKVSNGLEKMESLLIEAGREARQRLFLYCLIQNNFDVTQACHRVNITKSVLSKWVREDIKFADMLQEIKWHKGNFYESALVRLVAEGDTNAVIFANKTYNKDRGYNDKVEIQSSVTHLHAHFTIDDLDLPMQVRVQILEAVRKKKEALNTNNNNLLEGRKIIKDDISQQQQTKQGATIPVSGHDE